MKIKASALWSQQKRVLLDVRTPAEYEKGHIPGAINFPLFTNEERVIVGTLYKQESPETAMIKGLELVGPKMSLFVQKAKALAPNKQLIVHCWRGGKRSGSMAWLLRMAGYDVYTIEGGYKAYRNFIQQAFKTITLRLLVLGGRTGCAKTELLKDLATKGEQVIDLEGLAHHKGSAFGALGEVNQPTTEQFENNLFEQFQRINLNRIVWVENENKVLGKVSIPEGFWKQMKQAPLFNLARPLAIRKEIIRAQYGHFPITALKTAFEKIKKRLGGQNLNIALEALDQNDLSKAIEIALYYYDKAYQHYLEKNTAPLITKYESQESIRDDSKIVEELRKWSSSSMISIHLKKYGLQTDAI